MFEQISSGQNSRDNIDVAFTGLIEHIKSLVLNKLVREERQIVAAWVNKLSESSSSETEKKNRNLYAQILLKMMQRSQLKKPFTEKPNPGKLPTIPVYMSSYLDETEPLSVTNDNQPNWLLSGEDSMFLNSFNHDKSVENESKNKCIDNSYISYPTKEDCSDYFQIPEANELELYLTTGDEKNILEKHDNKDRLKKATVTTLEMMKETTPRDIEATTLDDDDSLLQKFEMFANDFNYSPLKTQSIDDSSKERALEKKLEFLGKKIEVESTKIQQQQDAMVKNILDRKNNEMNEIKLAYEKKIAELDSIIDTRNQTISTINTKLNKMQEQNDEVKQLKDDIERKESMVKSTMMQENELKEKIKNMEIEMKNLRRSHFEHVEKLVVENESNILKVREKLMKENGTLKEKTSRLIEDLKRAEEIKTTAMEERDVRLAKEEEYILCIKQLQMDVSETNNRLKYMESENLNLTNVKQNLENDLNGMKCENLKTNKTIAAFQLKIKEFKCIIEDLESTKQAEVKDVKIRTKEKIMELESSLKRKIQTLQKDFSTKESGFKCLLEQSSMDIDKKDKDICSLNEKIRKQSADAKQALEKVKKYAEDKIFKMHEDLNIKLNGLQASILRSEEKVKAQRRNIIHRFDTQRQNYEAKHLKYKCHMEEIHSKFQGKHNVDIMQYTEKVAKQKLVYEEKLRGLLPLHVKKELEDTIESMRQQIDLLQSQTDMLQEELDSVTTLNLSYKSNHYNLVDSTLFGE